jgi:hypothetical protein
MSSTYRDSNPVQVAAFSYVNGGTFLNIAGTPVYLEELLILGDNKRRLYSLKLQEIAKPHEFVVHRNPSVIEPESPDRQTEDVWQRAWDERDQCFRIDFRYPFKTGRHAEATLFFLSSQDGRRREKRFGLETVLVPKNANPCNLLPGIYR